MAQAFDSSSSSSTNWSGSTANTPNFAFTGNVMIAFAFIASGDFMTSITWNTSETFTFGAKIQNPGNEWEYIYYLLNPTNTTAAVVATASTNATNGMILVQGYSGAGTPKNFTTQTVTGTSITETITVGANSWIIGAAGAQRASTAGAGTIVRVGGTVNALTSGDSNGALSAGSQSIIFSFSSTTQVGVYCELPVPGAATNSNLLMFM